MKKGWNGRVLFSVGFVVEKVVEDGDEGDRFLKELDCWKRGLDSMVDGAQGKLSPKYRLGRKEWGVNKNSGWAVYGGQFSILASDGMIIEVKKRLRRDFREMKYKEGDGNLKRMRMVFWVARKKNGEWKLSHRLG